MLFIWKFVVKSVKRYIIAPFVAFKALWGCSLALYDFYIQPIQFKAHKCDIVSVPFPDHLEGHVNKKNLLFAKALCAYHLFMVVRRMSLVLVDDFQFRRNFGDTFVGLGA